MAIKLTTTKEEAKANGIKVLVYSRAGIGKTVLCATAPDVLVISAEAGLLSLAEANLKRLQAAGSLNPRSFDIPVIKINTVEDLMLAYNFVTQAAEAKKFQTIALDSLTEIAETVLANAKVQVKDPRQAYGELIEKMTMTVKAFRDLQGKNVYMSAKQELFKDEAIGTTTFMPSMPGTKLGQQLPYLFDEVFHFDIGATPQGVKYRYFRTQPDFQYVAKDRSGALDAIEQPDLGVVFAKILAG